MEVAGTNEHLAARPSFIHALAEGPWGVTGSGEVFALLAGIVAYDRAVRSSRGLHRRERRRTGSPTPGPFIELAPLPHFLPPHPQGPSQVKSEGNK